MAGLGEGMDSGSSWGSDGVGGGRGRAAAGGRAAGWTEQECDTDRFGHIRTSIPCQIPTDMIICTICYLPRLKHTGAYLSFSYSYTLLTFAHIPNYVARLLGHISQHVELCKHTAHVRTFTLACHICSPLNRPKSHTSAYWTGSGHTDFSLGLKVHTHPLSESHGSLLLRTRPEILALQSL